MRHKAAPWRLHGVGCSPTSKSRCWEIPSTQRGFADQILSRVEMFPERIEIGRARKYPAHPDARDRLHLGIRTHTTGTRVVTHQAFGVWGLAFGVWRSAVVLVFVFEDGRFRRRRVQSTSWNCVLLRRLGGARNPLRHHRRGGGLDL